MSHKRITRRCLEWERKGKTMKINQIIIKQDIAEFMYRTRMRNKNVNWDEMRIIPFNNQQQHYREYPTILSLILLFVICNKMQWNNKFFVSFSSSSSGSFHMERQVSWPDMDVGSFNFPNILPVIVLDVVVSHRKEPPAQIT